MRWGRKTFAGKLTYANVMSTIAVFLVLAGGVAWAGHKLIKGGQIKNGAINTKKLKNGAVTNPKIGSQAVDTGNLADKAAKQGKIGQNAIITEKLADGAVTTGKTSFAVASGRVISNPGASSTLTVPLVNINGISLTGVCTRDSSTNITVSISVDGPAPGVFSGVSAGQAPPATSPANVIGNSLPNIAVSLGPGSAVTYHRHADIDVVTPTNTLSASLFVAIGLAGNECTFSASGISG
ncbi:MAG: hypothetical protein QOD60_2273 [Solirubrobacterales bacterium]|nr:hypothetical protein [Solirubrobacterales bacterium]